jgi:hypothetical protein
MWDILDELSHQILMMGRELVPEMSIFNQLAHPIAREVFISISPSPFRCLIALASSLSSLSWLFCLLHAPRKNNMQCGLKVSEVWKFTADYQHSMVTVFCCSEVYTSGLTCLKVAEQVSLMKYSQDTCPNQ